MTHGDGLVASALQNHAQRANLGYPDPNPYFAAGRRIAQGMPLALSIDNFLDAHRGDSAIELCGKVAIVRAILNAERSSTLYTDVNRPSDLVRQESISDTWFNKFWKLVTEGCSFEQLLERAKTISFIVFNYDRCIEHFIVNAAQSYYGVNISEASRLGAAISFYHPYGSIAPLPWMSQPNSVAYGAEASEPLLLACAQQLKTFTEAVDHNSASISGLRNCLGRADRVVFLGFAFHRQNLKLMWPEQRPEANRPHFIGTAHGISADDLHLISSEIATLTSPQTQTYRDLFCNQLFHQFWRGLSMN